MRALSQQQRRAATVFPSEAFAGRTTRRVLARSVPRQRLAVAAVLSPPSQSAASDGGGKAATPAAQLPLPPIPHAGPDYTAPSRNLALELVRVTEAAALASARWLGKGDKNAADQAAVDMMRKVLADIAMDGVVVIGEGEKDEAPMLYCGEHIGDGSPPAVDIAVDPLDGTTLTAQGRSGAIAVIALAERGCLFDPGPCFYMEKLAVGPDVDPRRISLDFSVAHNLEAIANCLGKPVSDVTVLLLDRPRHAQLVSEIRAAGARIRMISDGDVGGAIETAKPEAPVDVMMGIGGTPEGVIAAAALKCMGGHIQGRLWARDEADEAAIRASGRDTKRILYTDDLVKGNDVFFAATGVSDGDLVRGVRFYSGGATTNSVVMRGKSQTVRYIETFHKWSGPAHAPSSPWHNQQLGALGGMAMRSSGGSPAPSVGGFLMDS